MARKDLFYPYYREAMDALLLPEGFVRIRNDYYRALKDKHTVQTITRRTYSTKYQVDYLFGSAHSSFGDDISIRAANEVGFNQYLHKIAFGNYLPFELYDIDEMRAKQKEGEEIALAWKAQQLHKHIDYIVEVMRTYGLPHFDKFANPQEHVDWLKKATFFSNQKGFYVCLYCCEFEYLLSVFDINTKLDINTLKDREEEIEKLMDESAKTTNETVREKNAVCIEGLQKFNAKTRSEIELIEHLRKMIEERDAKAIKEVLYERDMITLRGGKKKLDVDMLPLDLDAWEERARAVLGK